MEVERKEYRSEWRRMREDVTFDRDCTYKTQVDKKQREST